MKTANDHIAAAVRLLKDAAQELAESISVHGQPDWAGEPTTAALYDETVATLNGMSMVAHTLQSREAELRKLQAENADLYAEIERAIDQRDTAEGWADGLANLIGEYFGDDIGEHSNLHNPWQEARNIIEEAAQYKPAPVALGDAEVLSMSQALFMMRDADARDAARPAKRSCSHERD